MSNPDQPLRILALFPHPDDAVFCAAGTLARWVSEGHEVVSVCCTRGDMGTLRRDQRPEEVQAIRTAELEAANRILGIRQNEVLDFPDGCLLDPAALRKELVRCVRQYRPDRVMTMDPWVPYEVHRDHQVVGQMAAEAAAFAGFPLLHPEQLESGLEPHHASEVWFMGILGKPPNTFVSTTDFIDKKADALVEFEVSLFIIEKLMQQEGGKGPQELSLDEVKARVRRWVASEAAMFGQAVDLPAAEAFLVQKCLPGHFDNFPEIHAGMLGHEVAGPKVYR